MVFGVDQSPALLAGLRSGLAGAAAATDIESASARTALLDPAINIRPAIPAVVGVPRLVVVQTACVRTCQLVWSDTVGYYALTTAIAVMSVAWPADFRRSRFTQELLLRCSHNWVIALYLKRVCFSTPSGLIAFKLE